MSVHKGIPKVDGMGLVLGKPVFTDDLAPRDALIVKVLRSPHAFAKIIEIDTRVAEKFPEIKCVLTYKDVPARLYTRAGQGYPEPSPYDHKILDEVVRYIGDPVAIIAGTSEEIVNMAMKKIKVKYEVLEAVLDFHEAKDNPSVLHPKDTFSTFPIGHQPKRNIAATYEMEIGQTDEVLKKSDVVYEGRYHTPAQSHCMTEPHSAVSYYDVQNRLTIISTTQTPFHVRRILGKTLQKPLSGIRVIKPRVGGAYGGKQAIHGEFYVALVTERTGLPAKMVYDRKEVFDATYTRHEMEIAIRIGAMKDGQLTAIDMEILSNTGAYGEHALTVLMVAGSKTLPLYNKVEAVKFSGEVVYTNTCPAGAFRGYGAVQGNFALESAIDEIASMLDLDPVYIRSKNMIKKGETSKIFELMGEGHEGVPMVIESCALEACIEEGKKMINWEDKYPYYQVDDDHIRGVGMAIAMQGSGIPYFDMASAIIKLNDDGFYNLLIGATDLGTGSDTILSQIAAEVLKTEPGKVIPYSSDTDLTPFDPGAYASSTTYVSGHSVRIAAEGMLTKLLKAAEKYIAAPITFDGETFTNGREEISLKDMSERLYYNDQQEQLVSTGSYVGVKSPPPYMAGFAEVEVNRHTGQVKLLDYVATVDCGVAINPSLARIQVEGALVQGIGFTLYEEVKRTGKGKLITDTFMRYKVPTRMEVPPMKVAFMDSYEPSGPFGAKSVGEIGIDTPPAAIGNALKNITGKRFTRLPITSQDLWEVLQDE